MEEEERGREEEEEEEEDKPLASPLLLHLEPLHRRPAYPPCFLGS